MSETEGKNQQWDEWFDAQYDLNERIERAAKGLSMDKGDGFRVALYAAVIEHCAEAMRTYIPDVALAPAPAGDSGGERGCGERVQGGRCTMPAGHGGPHGQVGFR